jgi:membrane protein required for colicin V production
MSSFDIVILGLLALFGGIGALRGAGRELMSFGVWLLAILSGWLFTDAVATWFEQLPDPELRRLVAFAATVVATLAVLTLVMFVVRVLLPRPAPNLVSRIIGGLVGTLRGAVVVTILIVLAGLTSLPRKDDWRHAYLVGLFQPAAAQILEFLPAPVARQFRYG